MALMRVGHAPGSQNEKDWHAAIGAVVMAGLGTVCETCGLEQFGHGPESQWLGYERHAYAPVKADSAMTGRARELSKVAYANRRANGTNFVCGHRYPNAQCKAGQCAHVGGHCDGCN